MGGIMAEASLARRKPRRALRLALLLWATGCAAPAGSDPPSPDPPSPAAPRLTRVAGTVRYEDRAFSPAGLSARTRPRPARGALVRVAGGEVTAMTRTDARGRFAVEAPFPASVQITALADVAWGDHRARVTDRGKEASVYAVRRVGAPGAAHALLATAASGLGGAFNVADVAFEAFAFYAPHVRYAAPPLRFRWEPGRPFPCGSCYDEDATDGDLISLGGGHADTDEYDDDIILHELGHYFVAHYSHDDSPGGFHRDRHVDPRLAFGEGLAYFFANLVRGTPVVVDTYAAATRVIDNEAVTHDGVVLPNMRGTATGRVDGDLREELTAAVLWDAFDPPRPEEPFDRLALGEGAILDLVVDHLGRAHLHPGASLPDRDAPGLDLSDLLQALVCFSGAAAADVAALAGTLDLPWTAAPCAGDAGGR